MSWDESRVRRARTGRFTGFAGADQDGHLEDRIGDGQGSEGDLYWDRPLRKNELIGRYAGRYPYFLQDTPEMDSHVTAALALVNTGRYTVGLAEWHIGHAAPGDPRDIAEEHPGGCVIEGRITRSRDGLVSIEYTMAFPRAGSAVLELQRRGIEPETRKYVRSRLENGKATAIVNIATVRPAPDGTGVVIEPPPGRAVIGDALG